MSLFLGKATSVATAIFAASLFAACTQVQRPHTEPYFATSTPPVKQEFRWSNGASPKHIDPARTAAAPEADIVRAVYDGLTTLDPKTLEPRPAIADKFTASEDNKTWTFKLRKDAQWSNGKRITANDVVASWKRVRDLADKAPHFELAKNIVGFRVAAATVVSEPAASIVAEPLQQLSAVPASTPAQSSAPSPTPAKEIPIGVKAVDDGTLEIKLEYADPDFPKLVADPVFRPVYQAGADLPADRIDKATITSGPFRIVETSKDSIVLERSDTYWNKAEIKLDRVRFVAAANAEGALDAYKKGELDAVTNAGFEPLALKLLTPYEDFRQTAHSALNFYEFNQTRAPFNDRRVRAALSYAIDRARLAEVELEGAAVAAERILMAPDDAPPMTTDTETAKFLLENSGYSGGSDFPTIRLVINRNETQQRVARAVARMWKQNLNLETEIIVKETGEMEAGRAAGDFDLIRRNVVLPSADEFVSLTAVFGSALRPVIAADDQTRGPSDAGMNTPPAEPVLEPLAEADLLYEARVIPLYFPVSYSLVRPYVTGFETNVLDATELGGVAIDSNWQPATR